jgi:hypothetical protein
MGVMEAGNMVTRRWTGQVEARAVSGLRSLVQFDLASRLVRQIMRDEDDEVYSDRAGGAGSFIAGMLLGALAGVAVGILYAPASGQSTRRRIRRKLDHLREEAGDRFDDFGRKARRRLAEIRE